MTLTNMKFNIFIVVINLKKYREYDKTQNIGVCTKKKKSCKMVFIPRFLGILGTHSLGSTPVIKRRFRCFKKVIRFSLSGK